MALKKCKECGSSLNPQTSRCPNCDAPTAKRKHRIGCLTSIVIFLIAVILFSYLYIFLPDRAEKRKELELAKIEIQKEKELQEKRRIEDEEKNRIEQEKKNQENVFLQNIEKHYRKVQALYRQGKFHESHKEIDHFIKYDKLDYKDTEEIYRNLMINKLDEEVRKIPASEYRKNLELYVELRDLDPSNERYQKKVDYYYNKWEEKEKKGAVIAERGRCDLELLNWSWTRTHGSLAAEGQVKNITFKKLDRVEALVTTYDDRHSMITSDSSLIEYDPIMPGQVSPFKVIVRYNPAIKGATVEFKFMYGKKIRTYNPKGG